MNKTLTDPEQLNSKSLDIFLVVLSHLRYKYKCVNHKAHF